MKHQNFQYYRSRQQLNRSDEINEKLNRIAETRNKVNSQLIGLTKQYEKRIKDLENKLSQVLVKNQSLLKQNQLYRKDLQAFETRLAEKQKLITMLIIQGDRANIVAKDLKKGKNYTKILADNLVSNTQQAYAEQRQDRKEEQKQTIIISKSGQKDQMQIVENNQYQHQEQAQLGHQNQEYGYQEENPPGEQHLEIDNFNQAQNDNQLFAQNHNNQETHADMYSQEKQFNESNQFFQQHDFNQRQPQPEQEYSEYQMEQKEVSRYRAPPPTSRQVDRNRNREKKKGAKRPQPVYKTLQFEQQNAENENEKQPELHQPAEGIFNQEEQSNNNNELVSNYFALQTKQVAQQQPNEDDGEPLSLIPVKKNSKTLKAKTKAKPIHQINEANFYQETSNSHEQKIENFPKQQNTRQEQYTANPSSQDFFAKFSSTPIHDKKQEKKNQSQPMMEAQESSIDYADSHSIVSSTAVNMLDSQYITDEGQQAEISEIKKMPKKKQNKRQAKALDPNSFM